MTTTRTLSLPTRRRTPFAHTAHRLAATSVYLAAWFWSIAVTAVVAVTLVIAAVNGSADVAASPFARQGSIWFPFSQAIIIVAAYLKVHVASGMTRRTFARAALVVSVATGLGYAGVLTALVLVERAVHDALGWEATITEVQLTDETSPVWMLFLDYGSAFVVGNLSGLLVGATYQRLGGWWGTVALPLAIAPILLTQYVGGARLADLPGMPTTTSPRGDLLVAAGVSAVLAIVVGVAFVAIVRRLPVAAAP